MEFISGTQKNSNNSIMDELKQNLDTDKILNTERLVEDDQTFRNLTPNENKTNTEIEETEPNNNNGKE